MPDYKRDHQYAQLALSAYGKNVASNDWKVVHFEIDDMSGFAAYAFENKNSNEIIIAFRGTDNPTPFVDGSDIPADFAIKGKKGAWDKQFTQALDFASELMNGELRNREFSVTGHSLGGALAQVVSQSMGLKGVAFDPGGAENLIHAPEFAKWNVDHGLYSGKGIPKEFNNYIVNNSAVSNESGDHLGRTTPVSGRANRELSLTDHLATKLGGVGVARDQLQRHNMERIERVFAEAARTGRLNQIGGVEPDIQTTPQLAEMAVKPSLEKNNSPDMSNLANQFREHVVELKENAQTENQLKSIESNFTKAFQMQQHIQQQPTVIESAHEPSFIENLKQGMWQIGQVDEKIHQSDPKYQAIHDHLSNTYPEYANLPNQESQDQVLRSWIGEKNEQTMVHLKEQTTVLNQALNPQTPEISHEQQSVSSGFERSL